RGAGEDERGEEEAASHGHISTSMTAAGKNPGRGKLDPIASGSKLGAPWYLLRSTRSAASLAPALGYPPRLDGSRSLSARPALPAPRRRRPWSRPRAPSVPRPPTWCW